MDLWNPVTIIQARVTSTVVMRDRISSYVTSSPRPLEYFILSCKSAAPSNSNFCAAARISTVRAFPLFNAAYLPEISPFASQRF